MKDLIEDIEQLLGILKLKVFLNSYQSLAEQYEKEKRSHLEYLHELLLRETEQRQQHKIAKLLKDAKYPFDIAG